MRNYADQLQEYKFFYQGPRPASITMKDERPAFIRHHSTLRDWNAYCAYSGSDETFTLISSVGKDLGLKRIGIHHEILLPEKRSSWPHAHKVEEEFVYILNGKPDIWINGRSYQAEPGDIVFFKPGSNYSHTIINNTSENVELLVLGEQETNDDQIYYPHHPDRNLECKNGGYLWEDRPEVKRGEHNGGPGDRSVEAGKWKFQKNISGIQEKTNGGEEDKYRVFTKGKDLGREFGAERVALHHVTLPTGYRSSIPHAESLEEEFVFVLIGNPIAWINGERFQLKEGDSVALPSGTGVLHTFLNESGKTVEFIMSGDTWKSGNKYIYGVNPELEREHKDYWWSDWPEQKLKDQSSDCS